MGDLSEHFSAHEFECPHCGKVTVSDLLIEGLERARGLYYPRGLRIVSGYRCPEHNASIDGAPKSRHMRGDAADIAPVMTIAQARAIGFRGIGYSEASGKVKHVDMRKAMTLWAYA